MYPKLIDVRFLENIFQELFQIWKHFPLTQQNENKIAYERKTNGNLKQQHLSFPMCKTIRRVTAQQLFELFYLFANRNK